MVDISTSQKADLYADALILALADIGEALGGPDINAALAALTSAQGYLISSIKDRNARRLAEKAAVEGLGNHVAAWTNKRIIDAQNAPAKADPK